MDIDKTAINKARATYYGFFASLFPFSFGTEQCEHLDKTLDLLCLHPLDEQSERALNNMQRRLNTRGFAALKNENERLFFRPDTVSIPMTASYFNERRDDGRKRLQMIEYLHASSFRRNSVEFKEHEDHIEFILLFLQTMIIQELDGDTDANALSRAVFEDVLNEMIDPFIDQLLTHHHSSFYRQVALALQSFIDFERIFFEVGKPPRQSAVDQPRKAVSGDHRFAAAGCIKIGQEDRY